MMLEQVIAVIEERAKPGDFIIKDNDIRTPDGYCPGCKAASWMGLNPYDHKLFVGRTWLQLNGIEHTRLINAADGVTDNMEPELRKRLLKACKL